MENTPFTVERLLQLPVFRGAEIMAGHEGISKEIYYISSVEMPDLTGFLRPNELIITTGYAFRHEPMLLCRLLDEMHRIGSSAIGIKTRRVIQEVPPEALYKSNLYGIPLEIFAKYRSTHRKNLVKLRSRPRPLAQRTDC